MYLAALLVLVGAVIALLVWLVRASGQVHVRNEVVAGVEHALSLIASEIREAQGLYTPYEYASPPASPWSQLSLETRKNAPTGETSTYVDFFLCGTRICVKREFAAPEALTPETIEIQSLQFTQVKTNAISSVHIVVEAQYGDAFHRAQTTVSLRAYE